MLNQHGYDELIITPAPLNAFTLIMIPMAVSKKLTEHMARCYCHLVYWSENIVYIVLFFIYELLLVPVIFVRVLYNIMRLAGIFSMIPLIVIWLFISPVVLVMGVCKDFTNFIKILCYNH